MKVLRTNDGHQINIPLSNDTANGLVLVSQATNTTGEVDPALSSVPSNVDTAQSGVVKISNELLEDSYFDLEAWISQKLVTRFVRGFSKWISQGNGSNVAALEPTAGPTTTASGVVAYSDIVALYGSVDAAYANDPSASWILSWATRAALMNVTDNFGHPLFQLTANGTNPPFQSIFGAPIVIDESAPALATGNKPISFGLASEQYNGSHRWPVSGKASFGTLCPEQ